MLNFGPITSFEVSWPSLQVTRLLTLRVCTGGFCARPLLHHHEEHWHLRTWIVEVIIRDTPILPRNYSQQQRTLLVS